MKQQKEYGVQVHAYGRAWMLAALAVMLLVPISMCVWFGVWPNVLDVLDCSASRRSTGWCARLRSSPTPRCSAAAAPTSRS